MPRMQAAPGERPRDRDGHDREAGADGDEALALARALQAAALEFRGGLRGLVLGGLVRVIALDGGEILVEGIRRVGPVGGLTLLVAAVSSLGLLVCAVAALGLVRPVGGLGLVPRIGALRLIRAGVR